MHLMQTSGVVLDLHCFLVSKRFICMLMFFMVCIGDAGVRAPLREALTGRAEQSSDGEDFAPLRPNNRWSKHQSNSFVNSALDRCCSARPVIKHIYKYTKMN